MIYLALYKNQRKITSLRTLYYVIMDSLTRVLTRGKYSHCELVIKRDDGLYDCYSSSVRDKGVRVKTMDLSNDKWDLIKVNCPEKQIKDYYKTTQNMDYDFFGAGGIVLPIHEDRNKAFCSEWCFNCLYDSDQGWRFSPNQLGVIVNKVL